MPGYSHKFQAQIFFFYCAAIPLKPEHFSLWITHQVKWDDASNTYLLNPDFGMNNVCVVDQVIAVYKLLDYVNEVFSFTLSRLLGLSVIDRLEYKSPRNDWHAKA